jgi:hypothetical protein
VKTICEVDTNARNPILKVLTTEQSSSYKRKVFRQKVRSTKRHIVEQLERCSIEYKRQLDERTAHFRQAIKALDEEIRNVQILFIQAYKRYERTFTFKGPFVSSSHLNEHVSNFAAVSTQVRVTLWKDNKLLMNKDRQFLVKLLRPEDRSDRCVFFQRKKCSSL